jgi:hypothetical protein
MRSVLLLFAILANQDPQLSGAPDSRPAFPLLKPFGDSPVAQPRVAATAHFGIDERVPGPVDRKLDLTCVNGLHVVGQCNRDIVYVSSGFGGTDFSLSRVLMSVLGGAGARRGPRIAAYEDRIVVTAPEGGTEKDRRILAVASADSGATWSKPRPVTDRAGVAAEALHDLAVTTKGIFAVVWLDIREGKGQAIYFSSSDDGGTSWSPNKRIYASPAGSVCECCAVTIASGPRNRLAVVFRNSIGGARDLWQIVSPDGGATFGEAQPIAGPTWKISACPMAEGAVAFRGDLIGTSCSPCEINNMDGELFYRTAASKAAQPLGAGRHPVIRACGGETFGAFVQIPDGHLMGFSTLYDKPASPYHLLKATAEEIYDYPSLEIGGGESVWLAFERKTKQGTRTGLLRLRPF